MNTPPAHQVFVLSECYCENSVGVVSWSLALSLEKDRWSRRLTETIQEQNQCEYYEHFVRSKYTNNALTLQFITIFLFLVSTNTFILFTFFIYSLIQCLPCAVNIGNTINKNPWHHKERCLLLFSVIFFFFI